MYDIHIINIYIYIYRAKERITEYENLILHEGIEAKLEGNRVDEKIVAIIYDGLGCCYHALKDYDLVFNNMDVAISKDPNNVQFYMNRAEAYYDIEKYIVNTRIQCISNPHIDRQN